MEIHVDLPAAVFTREVEIAVVIRRETAVEMEATSGCYCRCCRELFSSEGKKHSVNLFGERAIKEGICEGVREYGNIDVTTKDIGVLSTSICHSCYLLVKGIIERLKKFADICKENSHSNENGQKRSVAERSPSQIAISPVNHPKRSRNPSEKSRLARISLNFQPELPTLIDPEGTEVSIIPTYKTLS